MRKMKPHDESYISFTIICRITMIASKRLAVTEQVWIAHLKQIADEGDYVELPP